MQEMAQSREARQRARARSRVQGAQDKNLLSKHCSDTKKRSFLVHGDGTGQEEAKLQNASKLIVHTAIQQAVRQLSRESQQQKKGIDSSASLQFERGQLTQKHEKK